MTATNAIQLQATVKMEKPGQALPIYQAWGQLAFYRRSAAVMSAVSPAMVALLGHWHEEQKKGA